MDFDFKMVVWERTTLNSIEAEEYVLKLIKEGKVKTAQDIFNLVDNKDGIEIDAKTEILYGSEEYLKATPEDGHPTIEVLDDNGLALYHNGFYQDYNKIKEQE